MAGTGRRGGAGIRGWIRQATGCGVLLSLLFLASTSDLLHNHPGLDADGEAWAYGASGGGLDPASPPASPRHSVPCLACLHHRTPFMGSSQGTLEGRPVAVLSIRVFALHPSPSAPAISRADLRAPPASA